MSPTGWFLAVDLGKTHCRVGFGHDRTTRELIRELVGHGAVGLAEPDGSADAVDAVVDALDAEARSLLSSADGCIAGAGFSEGPWAAATAQLFIDALGLASCALTSDAIAAHVGACGGVTGAVLAAGTGSVAVGLDDDGVIHVVDGVGQWLGDDGSGAWIGLEGLRAALRARDTRGPRTSLQDLAEQAFGDLATLPRALNQTGNVPQAAAAFAAIVCAEAATDAVARSIVDRAAHALATTAVTAARRAGTSEVRLVGGLLAIGPVLLEPLQAAAAGAGIAVVSSLATALDGAARIAVDRSLPHEVAITRVESVEYAAR